MTGFLSHTLHCTPRQALDVACSFAMVDPAYAAQLAREVMSATFGLRSHVGTFDAAAALHAAIGGGL